MTWNQLVQQDRVRQHSTNRQELDKLRQVVARGLADAAVTAISPDLRFQAAYNAVLQLATMAIHCAGYRVTSREHHRVTFQALPLAMGSVLANRATYFDTCRRKRNILTYDQVGLISEAEVEDLIQEAAAFQNELEGWIRTNHPQFALP